MVDRVYIDDALYSGVSENLRRILAKTGYCVDGQDVNDDCGVLRCTNLVVTSPLLLNSVVGHTTLPFPLAQPVERNSRLERFVDQYLDEERAALVKRACQLRITVQLQHQKGHLQKENRSPIRQVGQRVSNVRRSEERRVGKEGRSGGLPDHL